MPLVENPVTLIFSKLIQFSNVLSIDNIFAFDVEFISIEISALIFLNI